ncbi:MAG: hypothetical protein DSM106950_04015 [Stigonema ocellatum SAG 48.90 = DSM 106950]|nr:hypothetical protein [Stigonema ocellatum SAG 48.90 = DSM 106950]
MGWEQNLCLLPEAESPMFTPVPNTSADLARALLTHYSFDLSGYSAIELVDIWQKQYTVGWLHLAVIEALYQGRYKAISVQQILAFWHRRGQAIFHFNIEFERLICSKFPENLTAQPAPTLPPVRKNTTLQEQRNYKSLPPANPPPDNSRTTWVNEENKGLSAEETQTRESRGSYKVDRGENVSQSLSIWTSLQNRSQRQALPGSSQSPIPNKGAKLLPPATNHPPIDQFTPETSDPSDSFTSKLKAMSHDKPRRNYVQEEPNENNS